MKNSFFVLLIFMSSILYSQRQNENDLANHYLQKSISTKKTANVLAVAGGTSFLFGLVLFVSDSGGGGSNSIFSTPQALGLTLSTFGVISALTSVPFYISAGNNKSKYRKISPQIGNFITSENNYVTAGLQIEF